MGRKGPGGEGGEEAFCAETGVKMSCDLHDTPERSPNTADTLPPVFGTRGWSGLLLLVQACHQPGVQKCLCHPTCKLGFLAHCIFEVEKGAETLADGEDGEGLFI